IDPGWEIPVSPHPATDPAPALPVRTLLILEGDSPPDDALVAADLEGRWLWIPGPGPGVVRSRDWNLRAFQVLTDLYQLTTRNPGVAPPTVVTVGGGGS